MRMASVAAMAVLALPCVACSGALDNGGPKGPLPAYSTHAAALFDDGIEGTTVGYRIEHVVPPKEDKLLRERTQVGDGVVRARVVTITSKREGGGLSWQVGLHTIEKLAGERAPEGDFTLQVAASDPAAGILGALDTGFVGVHLVAFLRTYAPNDPHGGDPDVHFHIAPDHKDEIDAVRAAVASADVRVAH